MATDPDCDRVGIAVKNTQGEYVLLSGNETGMLLLDYICSRRTQMKTMPEDPVTVKTIVTIDMAERIWNNIIMDFRQPIFMFIEENELMNILMKLRG